MTLKLWTLKPPGHKPPPQPQTERSIMGLVYADIELVSNDDLTLFALGQLGADKVRRMTVRALVDSGAEMLAINERIKAQLGLRVLSKQFGELADGSTIEVEIVGPLEVRFANRDTTARAMVLPGNAEVLLGAIPMEDMDILVDPKNRQLIVNPAHPYVPQKSLK